MHPGFLVGNAAAGGHEDLGRIELSRAVKWSALRAFTARKRTTTGCELVIEAPATQTLAGIGAAADDPRRSCAGELRMLQPLPRVAQSLGTGSYTLIEVGTWTVGHDGTWHRCGEYVPTAEGSQPAREGTL